MRGGKITLDSRGLSDSRSNPAPINPLTAALRDSKVRHGLQSVPTDTSKTSVSADRVSLITAQSIPSGVNLYQMLFSDCMAAP